MDSLKKGVFTIKRMLKNSSKDLRSMDSCVDKPLRGNQPAVRATLRPEPPRRFNYYRKDNRMA